MSLQLKIVSPEKVEYNGKAESVRVPGTLGQFEILQGHAAIISSLQKGMVEFATEDGELHQLNVTGGFVEVKKDEVSLCVERAE